MNLYQKKLALEKLLEQKYYDRSFWKAHPTYTFTPIDGMATNREDTEFEIEAIEKLLLFVNEQLDKDSLLCEGCKKVLVNEHETFCPECKMELLENQQQKYGERI